jgi:hypothetical protein
MRTNRVLVAALGAVLAAVGLPLLTASPAGAATYTVTTTLDEINGASNGTSLREAILDASGDETNDTVALQPGEHYSLTRCAGDPGGAGDLDHHALNELGGLTIDGNGATIEQTCPGERVLDANAAGPAGTPFLDIDDLTLTGGDAAAGAALRVQGNLTLEDLEVIDNAPLVADSSALLVDGPATSVSLTDVDVDANGIGLSTGASVAAVVVETSRFRNNEGSGIASTAGTVDVRRSFFRNNGNDDTTTGGAISAHGALTVFASSLIGNIADQGGATWNADAPTTLRNSTVANNQADVGGGVYMHAGSQGVGLEHVTLYGNHEIDGTRSNVDITGGLASEATIFAQAVYGGSCFVDGVKLSGGGNVDAANDCTTAGPSDQVHTLAELTTAGLVNSSSIDAVMLPTFGSNVVDTLPSASCQSDYTADQRGLARQVDGDFDDVVECDAGAVELPQGQPFTDVGAGHPFVTEIGWMAWNGISTGSQPGPTYKPSDPVSRQAMGAFMYRLAGSPGGSHPNPGFGDVTAANPFLHEISWMVDEGIADGFPGNVFKPAAAVSRQAMSAFMYRLAGEPIGPFPDGGFSDVSPSNGFYLEISWMAHEGITTGFGDDTFRPAAPVSRQAMSAFMFRLSGQLA